MPVRGPLSHIDLSIRDPRASIPFYSAFFEALGTRFVELVDTMRARYALAIIG